MKNEVSWIIENNNSIGAELDLEDYYEIQGGKEELIDMDVFFVESTALLTNYLKKYQLNLKTKRPRGILPTIKLDREYLIHILAIIADEYRRGSRRKSEIVYTAIKKERKCILIISCRRNTKLVLQNFEKIRSGIQNQGWSMSVKKYSGIVTIFITM